MNFDQVKAVAAVLFFLAAVVTAMWGTQISGALAGAWSWGSAQTAAERRRMAGAAREARDRNTGGRGLSGAARRIAAAASGLRGPRAGANPGTRASAGRGPFSRIARAAGAGARLGWRAGAAGISRRRMSRGTTPGGATRSSRGPWRGRRKRGVCDDCGRNTARRSLRPFHVPRPGGGWLTWLLCLMCRNKRTPGTLPAGPSLPAAPSAAGSLPAAGSTVLTAEVLTSSRPPRVLAAVGAGGTAGAPRLLVSDGPLAIAATSSAPPDAAEVAPAAPAQAITTGTQSAITTGGAHMAAAIGSGRPGSGVAVLEGSVVGQPGSAVATRPSSSLAFGDAVVHSEWEANAAVVLNTVLMLFALARQVQDELRAGDCPDEMVDQVGDYADLINAYGAQILADLQVIDEGVGNWVRTVMANGGHTKIAGPEWHEQY